MASQSAGILFYRYTSTLPEVLLVHPGGPFWSKKDKGAWSVPKGEIQENETPLAAARREIAEETGIAITGTLTALTPVKQKGGKTVFAWACLQDTAVEKIKSNTFDIEWPPRSGRMQSFPEIDKAAWFNIPAAMEKILESQQPLLLELQQLLNNK
jgi:predicted NUDIX family NTP pyrophosphohydrolase